LVKDGRHLRVEVAHTTFLPFFLSPLELEAAKLKHTYSYAAVKDAQYATVVLFVAEDSFPQMIGVVVLQLRVACTVEL
jgi:hypothetical protein